MPARSWEKEEKVKFGYAQVRAALSNLGKAGKSRRLTENAALQADCTYSCAMCMSVGRTNTSDITHTSVYTYTLKFKAELRTTTFRSA